MRSRTARMVLEALFGWLSVVAASISWWATYQDARAAILVAVTATVGVAIATLGARFRWSTAVVALATLGAYLVLGVPLAVPSGTTSGIIPTLDGLHELLVSTALGWKQLVTITLPVGSYQGLLVPLFVLVLLVAVVSVTAALRAPARFGDLGVLVPALVFVAGIAFGAETVTGPRWQALAVFVVAVAWLVVRHRASRTAAVSSPAGESTGPRDPGVARLRLRSLVTGGVILAVAAGAASAISLAAPPSGGRQVVRTAIEQPFDPRAYTSPLAAYRAYLDDGDADAVMLTLDGLPAGARVRIATLDSYDGIVYSIGSDQADGGSGYFTRVPYRFDQSHTAGTDATVQVTVGAYTGVWVPTVGATEAVDFTSADAATLRDSFFVDTSSGTAADTAGLREGDSYTLSAVVPTTTPTAALAGLQPGSADVPSPQVVPDELEVTLGRYTADAATPGQKLVAMLAGLAHDGYVSDGLPGQEPSRSGHSADRITQLLSDGRMIGDAEQYAVTAALMARQLGFPARVVFGFAPTVVAGQETTVRGSDVSAWIEVNTASRGWVAVDPTPPVRPIPPADVTKPDTVSRPPSIVQPPADEAPPSQQQSPPEASQDPAKTPDALAAIVALVASIVGGVAILLLLVATPFVVIVALKARRRRRRRSRGSPRDRVRAGWLEFEDDVRDHGIPVAPASTRREFARSVGVPGAAVLATVADRAVFAPESLDDDEAARVWSAVDELREGLDRRATRRERWAARVSARSLRRAPRARR